MRLTLLLAVLVSASLIGCVEKGADGNTTDGTDGDGMDADGMDGDGMDGDGMTNTTTNSTTTTMTPTLQEVCTVWIQDFESRNLWSPPAPSPGAVWVITVDTENASVRSAMITAVRETLDREGEPREGSQQELALRTNAKGEASYTWEPPAATGKYRLTITEVAHTAGSDDCRYADELNEVQVWKDQAVCC